jgi:hypothetical protein
LSAEVGTAQVNGDQEEADRLVLVAAVEAADVTAPETVAGAAVETVEPAPVKSDGAMRRHKPSKAGTKRRERMAELLKMPN